MANMPVKAFCAPHTVMGGATDNAGSLPQVDICQRLVAGIHARTRSKKCARRCAKRIQGRSSPKERDRPRREERDGERRSDERNTASSLPRVRLPAASRAVIEERYSPHCGLEVSMIDDPYAVLGVARDASAGQIHEAYF